MAPKVLQALVFEERARVRFTPEELANAAQVLGFGREGEVGVELDVEVDDAFVVQAWCSAQQRAWQQPVDAGRRRAELNDALKIVAQSRGSQAPLKVWREEKGSGMSPEMADSVLDVALPRDVDEAMLLTVYLMRVRAVSLSCGLVSHWIGLCRLKTRRARRRGCMRRLLSLQK